MNTSDGTLPWHVPVSVSEIPESGKHFEIVASEAARQQIAQLGGLRALPRLQARFDIKRHGSDGLRVDGEVSATVGQNCVVTLDPIDSDIQEPVNLVFAPPQAPLPAKDQNGEDAGAIGFDDPEPLEGNAIDLGVIATEFLLVGIDPYPRKPGVTFDAPTTADESEHPFAKLAVLKKTPETKE